MYDNENYRLASRFLPHLTPRQFPRHACTVGYPLLLLALSLRRPIIRGINYLQTPRVRCPWQWRSQCQPRLPSSSPMYLYLAWDLWNCSSREHIPLLCRDFNARWSKSDCGTSTELYDKCTDLKLMIFYPVPLFQFALNRFLAHWLKKYLQNA